MSGFLWPLYLAAPYSHSTEGACQKLKGLQCQAPPSPRSPTCASLNRGARYNGTRPQEHAQPTRRGTEGSRCLHSLCFLITSWSKLPHAPSLCVALFVLVLLDGARERDRVGGTEGERKWRKRKSSVCSHSWRYQPRSSARSCEFIRSDSISWCLLLYSHSPLIINNNTFLCSEKRTENLLTQNSLLMEV